MSRTLILFAMALLAGVCPLPTLAQQQASETETQNLEVAPASASAALSEDEMEVLVARIALYPDDLVAVITSASLYPLQIVEASRYLAAFEKDSALKPKESWDGSVISLLNYPDVLNMMAQDLDWTQLLGAALAYQQKDMLIAIQQLRDEAVANGVIKTDDKIIVQQENNNVTIQPVDGEKIYVPRYEPEMLYEPGVAATPIDYYPDPYPSYFYPSAPFFAAAVTGAVWGAVMDWDDWGVWGGSWDHGNVDIDFDCDHCLNNIDLDGKLNLKDVDWKNIDRSKITFDKDRFANLKRTDLKKEFKSLKQNNIADKAKIGRLGNESIRNKATKISVNDIRKSKLDAGKAHLPTSKRPAAIAHKPAAKPLPKPIARPSKPNFGEHRPKPAASKKLPSHKAVAKPKPGGKVAHASHGGAKPSALGHVQKGKKTKMHAARGHNSMGHSHAGKKRPVRRHK